MSRKPALRGVKVTMSAECALCGDTLLTSPRPIGGDACEKAKEDIERLFAGHLRVKHSALGPAAAVR